MTKVSPFYWCFLWWALVKVTWADDTLAFVDPTFNCPALTTCRQVCVATMDDCPASLRCQEEEPGANMTLCADGSCAEFCDPDLESPCFNECAPVACQRGIVDTDEQCRDHYQSIYDDEDTCAALEYAVPSDSSILSEPAFIAAYCWIGGLALLIVLWCAYNQRISPIPGSCQVLDVEMTWRARRGWVSVGTRVRASDELAWFQTGYVRHPVGICLYALTLGTMAGFVALLIWLTLQYYSWRLYKRKAVIETEDDAAKAFLVVWSVALVWFLVMKWPTSIESLFLRRCHLREATYLAIFNNRLEYVDSKATHLKGVTRVLHYVFTGIGYYFHSVMSAVFSDVSGMNNYMRGEQGDFKLLRVEHDPEDETRYFVLHFRRYNLNRELDVFIPGVWKVGESIGEIALAGGSCMGLSNQDVMVRRRTVDRNVIEVEKPSFLGALFQQMCKPFYIYQFFIIMGTMPYYYYFMGVTYTVVVLCGLFVVSWLHYRSLRGRYRLTSVSGQIEVLRQGQFVMIGHEDLVPGDIVQLGPGIVYADMVLLSSRALLMDESSLTGESTPQPKDPITQTPYSWWGDRSIVDAEECRERKVDIRDNTPSAVLQYDRVLHRAHSISAGTFVLETDKSVAIITATGSHTAKGELLREMFSFQRHQVKFDKEIGIVIGILILYLTSVFAVVIQLLPISAVYKCFFAIYLFLAAINPLLPTALLVSVGVSDHRLAKKRITCLDSHSILIAGKVTHAFFDKTGTLTKQGLDFLSARSATDWNGTSSATSAELGLAMACCHSMTKTKDGALVGNPLDTAMFVASRATLEESGEKVVRVIDPSGSKFEFLRRFNFDHQRMTQAVVVRRPDGRVLVLVKGSAESIRLSCNNNLPVDFDLQLRDSAKAGHYQISVAYKTLNAEVDVAKLTRDEVERNVDFVGVLNFTNAMREETPDVVRQLKEGGIIPTVVTGDNVMTGIRIAQESGIMDSGKAVYIGSVGRFGEVTWSDEAGQSVGFPSEKVLRDGSVELAIYGSAWKELMKRNPHNAVRMASHIRVYGRCTPHDKVAVIDAFVNAGCITLMCGDGGNDCGALKAAHVGVALSQAEASVVSPFTSLDKSLISVLEVIKIGRCALPSTFATYKYLVMYGLMNTTVMLTTAYLYVFLSEWSFVMMDGIWTITLAFSLPLAREAEKLSSTRPTSSLLSPTTVGSCIGIAVLNFLFVVVTFKTLWHQDWFQCRKWIVEDSHHYILGSFDNYEAEVLFLLIGSQILSTAMAFNFGYEFRQGWYRNYVFVAFVTVYSLLLLYITLVPGKLSCFWRVQCTNDDVSRGVTIHYPMPVQNRFNTTVMPLDFRWKLVSIMVSNAMAVCGYEYFVVHGIRRYIAARKQRRRLMKLSDLPSEHQTMVVDCSVLPSPAVVVAMDVLPEGAPTHARSTLSDDTLSTKARSAKHSKQETDREAEMKTVKFLVDKVRAADRATNEVG